MGFFRIFYFLKRILYKIPKKILIYLLIFVIYFVFLFSPSSHASQIDVNNVPNADIIQMYKLKEDTYWYTFVYGIIKKAKSNNNTFDTNIVSKFYSMTQIPSRYVWGIYDANYVNLFFTNSSGTSPSFSNNLLFLAFANTSGFVNADTVVLPGTSNSSYSSSREVSNSIYSNSDVFMLNPLSSSTALYTSYNISIIDAFQNYIPKELYQTVYDIGLSQFNFETSDDLLNEISQKIDETNQQLEEMNDFFNSTTTPTITNNDLPSDNLTDITSSGFDGIFTKIYNKTTNGQSEYIQVTIPYMNYTFYVTSDFLSDLIYNQSFIQGYTLRTFIQLLWSFFIFRYIVLDVYKYINDFKNGNISKTDTNIKADML